MGSGGVGTALPGHCCSRRLGFGAPAAQQGSRTRSGGGYCLGVFNWVKTGHTGSAQRRRHTDLHSHQVKFFRHQTHSPCYLKSKQPRGSTPLPKENQTSNIFIFLGRVHSGPKSQLVNFYKFCPTNKAAGIGGNTGEFCLTGKDCAKRNATEYQFESQRLNKPEMLCKANQNGPPWATRCRRAAPMNGSGR